MPYPVTVNVTFDFSSGPIFGYPFTLDSASYGLLDKGILLDSASNIVDISNVTLMISTNGGYNLLQDKFQLGQATIRILDTNGNWNPQNPNSIYYPNLVPLRKIQVTATYLGVTYYIYSGYTQSYNYTYDKPQNIGYVDIICADAFRLFNLSNVTTIANAVANQDTGTRINAILDQIGWPTSMRSVTTGGTETICQADPGTNRTALAAISMVEFTEQGAFYIDPAGVAVFKSRAEVMATNGTNPTSFANNNTAIPYTNVAFAFDDKLIINQTNMTRTGGSTQTYSDLTSISTYFPHSFTQQNLLMTTDADAYNLAALYCATRATTTIRIDSMTLNLCDPAMVTAGVVAALYLDYFNTVAILNVGQTTTSGTSNITKTLQVMGVAHSITPTTWETTFTTSEPIDGAFLLDSTLYGLLDNSDSILAY